MAKNISHNRFLILIGAVAIQTACNYHANLKKPNDHNLINDNLSEISIKYPVLKFRFLFLKTPLGSVFVLY